MINNASSPLNPSSSHALSSTVPDPKHIHVVLHLIHVSNRVRVQSIEETTFPILRKKFQAFDKFIQKLDKISPEQIDERFHQLFAENGETAKEDIKILQSFLDLQHDIDKELIDSISDVVDISLKIKEKLVESQDRIERERIQFEHDKKMDEIRLKSLEEKQKLTTEGQRKAVEQAHLLEMERIKYLQTTNIINEKKS